MKCGVIVLNYYIHTRNLPKRTYNASLIGLSLNTIHQNHYKLYSGLLLKLCWYCSFSGSLLRRCAASFFIVREISWTLVVKDRRPLSSKVTDPHSQRSQTLIVRDHRPSSSETTYPYFQRSKTLILKDHRPSSSKITYPHRQRSQTLIVKDHIPTSSKNQRPSSSKITDPHRQRSHTLIVKYFIIKDHRPSSSKTTYRHTWYVVFIVSYC